MFDDQVSVTFIKDRHTMYFNLLFCSLFIMVNYWIHI